MDVERHAFHCPQLAPRLPIRYNLSMHEMSIAISLLEMAESEAARAGCSRLIRVTVHYGQISGIMPEALSLAFHVLTEEGPHQGAELDLVEISLRLRCPFCGAIFDAANAEARFQPCPHCGEEFGHEVAQGSELLLARVEAV